jgi:hypothetical protein
MARVKVRDLFVLEDTGTVIAHLDSFQWDFNSYADVDLCFAGRRVPARCIGCGDQKGVPVLTVEPKRTGELVEIARLWRDHSDCTFVQRNEEA